MAVASLLTPREQPAEPWARPVTTTLLTPPEPQVQKKLKLPQVAGVTQVLTGRKPQLGTE